MRSERDIRTVEDLAVEDAALHARALAWTPHQAAAAVVGAKVACRMIDRQLNDLRRQVERLGEEPCA